MAVTGQYMANDVFISVNGVDLSTSLVKITLDESANELDDTAMGATTESRKGGLKKWTMDVEFLQNHTGSSVDATLRPLLGTTTTVIVRPTSSAASSVNPRFEGTALVAGYKSFDVSVGDMAKAACRFVNAGTLTRATT